MTNKQIEEAFDYLYNKYVQRLKIEKKYTECEKVEMVMRNNEDKIWWYPYELIGNFEVNGEHLFIGYKAPARLYDLEQKGIVEGRDLGKYKVWRLI